MARRQLTIHMEQIPSSETYGYSDSKNIFCMFVPF
jgi:hypothetical protein